MTTRRIDVYDPERKTVVMGLKKKYRYWPPDSKGIATKAKK